MSNLKIFDKEYVYLNNISKILYSKIIYILAFVLFSIIVALFSTNLINQYIPQKHKYEIVYRLPILDEEFNTLIKDISKLKRILGFNKGEYFYTPEYLLFISYANFIVHQNSDRIFENLYFKNNSLEKDQANLNYKFFNFKDARTESRSLIMELESSNEKLIKDYAISFKNYYEKEFIDVLKKEYFYLIDLQVNELDINLKNEIIKIKIQFLESLLNNQNDINNSDREDISIDMITLLEQKYAYLEDHYQNMREIVNKNSFMELFNGGKLTNFKTYKNDIGYLPIIILTSFFSLIIISGFFLLLNFKSIKK